MKTVEFSKVYYYGGYTPYELKGHSKIFSSKKELIRFYNIKNVKVIRESFYINMKGTRHNIKVYSGEIEDHIAIKFDIH